MGKTVKPDESAIEKEMVISSLKEDNLRCGACGRILLYCELIAHAKVVIKCPSCSKYVRYYIGFKVLA